jgi:GNAT superfamily N-acetyltransferase
MTHTISHLDNRRVEMLQTQIVAIYQDAFCRPPYNKPWIEVEEFRQSLPVHINRADFRLIGAFDDDLDQIVGFAYGYTSQPGQWWYEKVKAALPAQIAAEWLNNSFQFAEIAVSPGFQGQGIGGRLYTDLLKELWHHKAILSTLQAETVAHRLYRNHGWVVLRENLFFPGVNRPYQIMGLEIA